MVKNYIHTVEIITNFSCNLRCKMCDGWKMDPPKNPPSLEDYKKALEDLKRWLGHVKIQIAGGEPLLNPNTIPIINIASSLGFTTSIVTNGSLLNEKTAKRLVDSGIDNVTISLDSLNPEVHDYMRGVNGTFNKVINALEFISHYKKKRDKPLYLAISSIVSKFNHKSLVPLIEWVYEKNLDGILFQAINDTFFNPFERGYDKRLWPMSENETKPVIETIEDIKKLKNKYPKLIINPVPFLNDMQDYFKKMHWMKNVRTLHDRI